MGIFDFANAAQAFREDMWSVINRDWQKDDLQDAREDAWRASNVQMDFQRDMASTAYQRAVQDLGKAGLNPMLAYQQGGASAPQGASNVVSAGGSPAQGRASNMFQAGQSAARADESRARTELLVTTNRQFNQEIERMARELEFGQFSEESLKMRREKLRYDMGISEWNATLAKVEAKMQEFEYEYRVEKGPTEGRAPEARRLYAMARLMELDIPKALNEALAEETAFKRYVSPFLGDVGKLTGSAATSAYGLRAVNPATRTVIHRRRP